MNQTAQQAAEQYINSLSYEKAHKTMGAQIIFDAFIAAAEWAALKWIPITERLPTELTPILTLIPEEDNEIAVCLYEKNEGFYLCYEPEFTPNVEYWCPIPDSLLNFKP